MREETPQLPDRVARTLLTLAVILLSVIAVLLGFPLFDHPPDTWSYSIVAPKDDDLIMALNKAGAAGWEVVSARRATSGEGSTATASYELILKRQGATKPLEPEEKIGDPINPK